MFEIDITESLYHKGSARSLCVGVVTDLILIYLLSESCFQQHVIYLLTMNALSQEGRVIYRFILCGNPNNKSIPKEIRRKKVEDLFSYPLHYQLVVQPYEEYCILPLAITSHFTNSCLNSNIYIHTSKGHLT